MSATLLASMVATSTLLACLSELESGNDDYKVGRAGEVSRYQIKPEVWRDITPLPIAKAKRADIARYVADQVQLRRATTFLLYTDRRPTVREWYILWNAPAQAYSGRPSRVVAKRAKRFENLVEAAINLKGR
jgi:hypothetical protein